MAVTQLGYVGLGVSDIDAWQDYATNVLGFQIGSREEDGTIRLRMDQNAYRFIVHPSGEDDLLFAGWEVKDEAALREIADRVRAAGIEVEEGSQDLVDARAVLGLIKFQDPAGLATEVFYGPRMEKSRPFHSPRGISGFETGENGNLGLGHIVLGVPDIEGSIAFYRDVLGFRISDYVQMKNPAFRMKMAFFHCNPRHHSLAVMGMVGTPPGPPPGAGGPPRKRLHHFMIEAKALDDVGMTNSLVEGRGIRKGALGRHVNDHMVSFYMQSPSGFQVEFGWGARLVDDDDWEVQLYEEGSIWGHGFPREDPAAAGAAR
jgi:2,3-dihydroxybiphenyl 1,2-dioxygenase